MRTEKAWNLFFIIWSRVAWRERTKYRTPASPHLSGTAVSSVPWKWVVLCRIALRTNETGAGMSCTLEIDRETATSVTVDLLSVNEERLPSYAVNNTRYTDMDIHQTCI